MSGSRALLAADRLTKRYREVVALEDVSFEITEGITGILGENGAGKSTAMKIFLGLIPATSGSARVLGEDVSQNVLLRSRLGYMPEHDCLPTNVSAAEFLTHMAEVSGLPPSHARIRAADTLRHTGLFEERYRAMRGYSTGMKQRVKLAQALVHDPVLVFLDEPTAGLDPTGREEMLDLVRKTHREFGISVLLSSHLMADVERTCDRIVVLQGGRLAHAGEVGQFTRDTETVFIEVDANRERLAAALQSMGVAVVADGHGLAVQGPDESVYDLVRDALVEAEAPLRRLAPRRRALMELFRTNGQGAGNGKGAAS
jgi:ABC-2 type transport system ATP-binding protein